jgi:hypothetical protein
MIPELFDDGGSRRLVASMSLQPCTSGRRNRSGRFSGGAASRSSAAKASGHRGEIEAAENGFGRRRGVVGFRGRGGARKADTAFHA